MFRPPGRGNRQNDQDDEDDERRRRERTHQYADEEPEEDPDPPPRRSTGQGMAARLAEQLRGRREIAAALTGPATPINRDRVRERQAANRARDMPAGLDTGTDEQRRLRAQKWAAPASATPAAAPRHPQRSTTDRFADFDTARTDIRFARGTGEENCRKHLRDDHGSEHLRNDYGKSAEEFAAYFISRAGLEDMDLHNRTRWDGQPSSEPVDTGEAQFWLYLNRVVEDPRLRGWKIIGYVNRDHLALTHMGPGP